LRLIELRCVLCARELRIDWTNELQLRHRRLEATLRYPKITGIDFVADRISSAVYSCNGARSCADERIQYSIAGEGEHLNQTFSKFNREGSGMSRTGRCAFDVCPK